MLLKDDDVHSFELANLSDNDPWKTSAIHDEVHEIMINATLLFNLLPILSEETASRWSQAFDKLFNILHGVRLMIEEQSTSNEKEQKDRLVVEEEVFSNMFFSDFHDMLVNSKNLGDFENPEEFADPSDDIRSIYKYVKQPRLKEKRSSSKATGQPSVSDDAQMIAASISQYLNNLVDVGTDEPTLENLMDIAKQIDVTDDSTVYKFFQLFRKQEFSKLYQPIRDSPLASVFATVLTRYYFEYAADPRIFSPPSFVTIIGDLKRRMEKSEH